MKSRTLLDGFKVAELDKAITLKVYTKAPLKWLLIDEETGVKYRGYNHKNDPDTLHWKKVME